MNTDPAVVAAQRICDVRQQSMFYPSRMEMEGIIREAYAPTLAAKDAEIAELKATISRMSEAVMMPYINRQIGP